MTLTTGNTMQHNTERFSNEEIERISEHINDFLEPQGDCLIWRGMTLTGHLYLQQDVSDVECRYNLKRSWL